MVKNMEIFLSKEETHNLKIYNYKVTLKLAIAKYLKIK